MITLDTLTIGLEQLPDRILSATDGAVSTAADETMDAASSLVPVRTGQLLNSGYTNSPYVGPDGVSISYGFSAPYAGVVEQRAGYMAAALDKNRAAQTIAEAVRNALR